MRSLGALSGLVILTACGGVSTSAVNVSREALRLESAAHLLTESAMAPNVPGSALPQSGSVAYHGFATVTLGTAPQTVALLGDADVVVEVGAVALRGAVVNVTGTDAYGTLGIYLGTLGIEQGFIDRAAFDTLAQAELRGTLSGNGDLINFDQPLDGAVTGDFGEFLSLASDDLAVLNGVIVGSQVLIFTKD